MGTQILLSKWARRSKGSASFSGLGSIVKSLEKQALTKKSIDPVEPKKPLFESNIAKKFKPSTAINSPSLSSILKMDMMGGATTSFAATKPVVDPFHDIMKPQGDLSQSRYQRTASTMPVSNPMVAKLEKKKFDFNVSRFPTSTTSDASPIIPSIFKAGSARLDPFYKPGTAKNRVFSNNKFANNAAATTADGKSDSATSAQPAETKTTASNNRLNFDALRQPNNDRKLNNTISRQPLSDRKFNSDNANVNTNTANNNTNTSNAIEEIPAPTPYPDKHAVLDVAELKRLTTERLSAAKSRGGKNTTNQQATASKDLAKDKEKKIPVKVIRMVSIPSDGLSLRELASRMAVKVVEVRAKLVELGELAEDTRGRKKSIRDDAAVDSENQEILVEADIAELVALEMGCDVKREESLYKESLSKHKGAAAVAAALSEAGANTGEVVLEMFPRSPIVCIMGHVDHGKTTLLDTLRSAHVAASEAGGITQKLSAFTVQLEGSRKVVFLDTPGHAAFTAMRSHGASATDVAVLVVAIDDGVRPQTIEALRIAKEANCTIIVALNKIDRIPATERATARARVLSQLVEQGVIVEEYGGDTLVVEVSGRSGEGVNTLVESIALQTDILELKAPIAGQAEAVVLDANVERGRGVVADVLVRWGSLKVGDAIVVGTAYGRVKSMVDSFGKTLESAGPATPVRLTGLRGVPVAGQEMISVLDESKARVIADRRQHVQNIRNQRHQQTAQLQAIRAAEQAAAVAAASAAQALAAGGDSELPAPIIPSGPLAHVNVILKADGVGTLQALEKVVEGIKERSKEVSIAIVDGSVGDITMSDVQRASTVFGMCSATIVLGFNVMVADSSTRSAAKELDVKIFRDTVIYRLEDELKVSMESLMPKERFLLKQGQAKVLKVIKMNDKAGTVVAGMMVDSGSMKTSGSKGQYVFKITRGATTILAETEDAKLKRFKDIVHEVEQGNECGLTLDKVKEFEEGDVIECFKVEMRPRKLFLDEVSSTTEGQDQDSTKNSNSSSSDSGSSNKKSTGNNSDQKEKSAKQRKK